MAVTVSAACPIPEEPFSSLESRGTARFCRWRFSFGKESGGVLDLRPRSHSMKIGQRPACRRPMFAEEHSFGSLKQPWRETLDGLLRPGIQADSGTYASLLRQCGNAKALSEGKRIHSHIIKSGHDRDRFLGNLLVQMYGQCGALEDACEVFARLRQRNVFSWTIMIGSYAHHGRGKEVFQLFRQMQLEGVNPDKVTYISILSACGTQAALAEGKLIHSHIVTSGLETDDVVGNALVNMYGKCGSLEDAQRVFDNMPERNVALWNAMIAAYAQHGKGRKALELFQQMQKERVVPDKATFVNMLQACASHIALAEGKLMHACVVHSRFELDCVVGTALVNMYSKCGCLEHARRLFDEMFERDVVLWTVMIAAYAQHGWGKEALRLFQQMQLEQVTPDKVTFISILDACASLAALAKGKEIHQHIMDSGFESDVVVANALVNMYGKCGSLKDARRMFDKMCKRNMISWTSMIAAYSRNGQGKDALQLFQQMQVEGVIPNEVTFVNILCTCSHTGMVDEGCHYFVSMSLDHGITPTVEHYNCMIDLLGRAGYLDEGEDLINSMPFQPTSSSWMTLLGACRMHSDIGRGKLAAKYAFKLDPENAVPYLLLSDIYAAAGLWADVAKVRNLMEENGLKKQPGCSFIEVKANA